MEKTVQKRGIPLTGKEGVETRFTSENQPTPQAKKVGWEQWRKERHLTQAIIKHLGQGDNLAKYVKSLHTLATQNGNSKAIEAINKGLEDDIIKIAQTDTEGNDIIFKLDERYKES